MSGAAALDDILLASTIYMHKTLGARCVVMLLPEDGELNLTVAWPPIDQLDPGETSAARWAFEKAKPAGWRTGTLPNVRFQFRPLVTTRGVGGVCGFEPADPLAVISPERERALNLILEQTAIAIDRSLLVKDSVQTAALEENEKLRTTLLSSLSHDLRTPLASITGAVTTLRQFGETMTPAKREDLLASIEEEAARLTRFVANLLDMSRIEAGALKPRRDFVDVAEVVRAAVERARKAFPDQQITTSLARDLPSIRGDANLLEQVLFNLFDNAQKYGGGAAAMVHARRRGRRRPALGHRRRPRREARRSRTHLREILSGRPLGRPQGRHRPRPVDLPRAGRGDGRNDPRGKSGGAPARHAHRHRPAGRPRRRPTRRRAHERRCACWWSTTSRRSCVSCARRWRPPATRCIHAAAGREALRLIANSAPDIVVLDLGLPDMDGKEVLGEARKFYSAPILVLSARDREAEKIAALDLGADDYVEKPFAIGELLARLRTALRHRAGGAAQVMRVGSTGSPSTWRSGRVTRNGAPVKLTPKEYDLLCVLARHAGRVITHGQILDLGLGSGAQGRHPISARLHRPVARKDRGRSRRADDHPHRGGDRLSVQRGIGRASGRPIPASLARDRPAA